MQIQSLKISECSLNNLLIFYIVDCPLLKTIEIGRGSLVRLGTLRITGLKMLTTLLFGDDAYNDHAESVNSAPTEISEEQRLTGSLDCQYKNKSLILKGCCVNHRINRRSAQFTVYSIRKPFLCLGWLAFSQRSLVAVGFVLRRVRFRRVAMSFSREYLRLFTCLIQICPL